MVKENRRSALLTALSLAWPAVLVFLAGCGYRSGFSLPEGVKTVGIKTFKNDTLYRGVDLALTEALTRELRAKTRLRLVNPQHADLVLSGKIAQYRLSVLREDEDDNVEEYQATISVDYTCQHTGRQEVLREGQTRRVAHFSLTRGQTEADGRRETVREVAREIVSNCFEPW